MPAFDIHRGSEQLAQAASAGDGLTTARILEEAGSCNWKALVYATNVIAENGPFKLSTSDELSNHGETETITLYKLGNAINGYGQQQDNRVYPLASVNDTRCEKK